MHAQRYRLKISCLATLIQPDGPPGALAIPAGSMVELIGEPVAGTQFVDVWEGKTCMVFTEDIRERVGQPLSSASSHAASAQMVREDLRQQRQTEN